MLAISAALNVPPVVTFTHFRANQTTHFRAVSCQPVAHFCSSLLPFSRRNSSHVSNSNSYFLTITLFPFFSFVGICVTHVVPKALMRKGDGCIGTSAELE